MVRWRCCFVLVVLLLLPEVTKLQEEEDNEPNDEQSEGDNDDDDDGDDEPGEKEEKSDEIERKPPAVLLQTSRTVPITRTNKRRPLECYVCAYKSDTPLKACLDPTKYRVQTITCHSVDDKCATTVISKGSSFEAVVRSCKSSCIGTPETSCCDLNRCNNQAFAQPTLVSPKALVQESSSKTSKCFPQSVLFFVTILLLLQTVVKVTFV